MHWLPIERRIDYKVATYAYKSLHNEAPNYTREVVKVYSPVRTLRPTNTVYLVETRREQKHMETDLSERLQPSAVTISQTL